MPQAAKRVAMQHLPTPPSPRPRGNNGRPDHGPAIPDLGAIYRKDSGCRKSPRCLDCPLPQCVYATTHLSGRSWHPMVCPLAKETAKAPAARSKPSLGNRSCVGATRPRLRNVARQRNRRAKLRQAAMPTRPVQTTCPRTAGATAGMSDHQTRGLAAPVPMLGMQKWKYQNHDNECRAGRRFLRPLKIATGFPSKSPPARRLYCSATANRQRAGSPPVPAIDRSSGMQKRGKL